MAGPQVDRSAAPCGPSWESTRLGPAHADGTVGVPVAELARALFERYPWTGWSNQVTGGYVHAVVLFALEERGLFAFERYRRLGLFDATRWVLTPAGSAAKTGLEASLAVGGLARGRRRARRLEDELRLLAGPLGSAADIDAAFAAIDRGVNKGWDAVYGGD